MRRINLSGCVVFAITAAIFALVACDEIAKSGGNVPAKTIARPVKPFSNGLFHNERLKRLELKDYGIIGDDQRRDISGMWVSESKDPARQLGLPEQVTIGCERSEKTCRELTVTLGVAGEFVDVMDGIGETIWQITSWDANGLLASYGPDVSGPASDRCHRRVLAMSFASGAVSTADIPTHETGCEAFIEANSYRLIRGNYYVDTTPANDVDKPTK